MYDFLSYLDLTKWGLLSCTFFSLSAGMTSSFILLNRNALLPHALTHILLLPFLILAMVASGLNEAIFVPLVVLLTLFITLFIWLLVKKLSIFEDAASAIVIHLALALALVLAVKGSQYDYRMLSYLFGDILLAERETFFLSVVLFLLTLAFYTRFSWTALVSALNWEFPGLKLSWMNLMTLLLICFQVVIGAKVLGVLLVSAFYSFSGVSALRLAKAFKFVPYYAVTLNVLAVIGGVILSYVYDIPFSAGAIIFMSLYLVPLWLKKE